MYCTLAGLDQIQLDTVRSLEQQTGQTVLAWSCDEVKPAQLDPEVLSRLQEVEKKTGLILVAVE